MASTDIEALRAQLDTQEELDDLVDRMTDEIARVVPDFSRFQRVAKTELRNNPKLQKCDAISFLSALMLSAQMGLEPGDQQGLSWLIPRKIDGRLQCTWLIGYRGVRALAMRTGRYKQIVTGTVKEGDEFDWRPVPDPFLRHVPANPGQRGDVVAYYAWAEPTEGNVGIPVVLEPEEIEKRRHVGGARGKPNNSPAWEKWTREMSEKTCVRAMARKLELSEAVIHAAESGAVIDPDDVEQGSVQIAASSTQQQPDAADEDEAATTPSGDPDEAQQPAEPATDDDKPPRVELSERLQDAGVDPDHLSVWLNRQYGADALAGLPDSKVQVLLDSTADEESLANLTDAINAAAS